jgi:hypothetical protein
MIDNKKLLDTKIPLSKRYDEFIIFVSGRNNSIPEFVANDLGIEPWQVDVFFELNNLDEEEFEIIDKIGFDIGHLFVVVRAERRIRNLMYERCEEILTAEQPLTILKNITDENSHYNVVEQNIHLISAKCYKSLATYLKDTKIVNGTITSKFSSFLNKVSARRSKNEIISEKMASWIIRAIHHDKEKNLGIFTNDIVKNEYPEDLKLIVEISENIDIYASNK